MIGHLKTSFNNLLDIKSVIGIETKDVEIEDYVGTILEIIRMAENGDNKGVYPVLQYKKFLEQLKARVGAETANIKAKLGAVREGTEIADHEKHKVGSLNSYAG